MHGEIDAMHMIRSVMEEITVAADISSRSFSAPLPAQELSKIVPDTAEIAIRGLKFAPALFISHRDTTRESHSRSDMDSLLGIETNTTRTRVFFRSQKKIKKN